MTTIHDAIDACLRDAAVGLLPRSLDTYGQGLKRFAECLADSKIEPDAGASALSVDHALECARWLSERDLAKTTLRTYLSAISRLYSFLLRNRIVEFSAADVERMRVTYKEYRRGAHRGLPKLPPDKAVTALLAAARNAKVEPVKPQSEERRRKLAYLRNIAMLESLRTSGMRIGELVRMKRDDLNYRDRTARVKGKGGKPRVVYFDEVAWQAIQVYLKERQDGASGRALNELSVFAQHGKRAGSRVLPLTTHQVRKIFVELVELADIDVHMTPHSLRHAFATKVLDKTGDLSLVQEMLGHESPATTRIYAQVSNRKTREAHKLVFGG